ncbi:cobyric acid synthase [Halanaerobium hydrogeniformans]|uniref:Cobyric acid synthase n=1 Tax=Halanaerobium hydrogeniformans TaxID=656519 RepID=E4RKA4_HALHG|nr:cobyric acid synthase [Halanaerobium hydrogeniformans]ADQ15617.1 cobyric acid synthase CobQ [Halanaerobium hydrogeniformans]
MTAAIMFQGTASDAGKSIITAAACRVLAQDGYLVAPFKSQNMSLNSWITKDAKEIAVAQAVQAEAAQVEPIVEMSPILLKPNADNNSQVILQGKLYKNMNAADYFASKDKLLEIIKESLTVLKNNYKVIVLEGGGNPAEVNLRDKDLVNMKAAELAESPVILIADIDKGGVFASVIGTLELLTEEERARVKGIIINKFRGDPKKFEDGVKLIEEHTSKQVLGVLPYLEDLDLPAEDSLENNVFNSANDQLDIVVVAYPQMSNFTDFDYFKAEKGVQLRYIRRVEEIADPDLIILPGSKTTIKDLKYLYSSKMADKIKELAGKGKDIIGICGGYQMLGKEIRDPENFEISSRSIKALNLLNIKTVLAAEKVTNQITASSAKNLPFETDFVFKNLSGFEIHQGRTIRDSNVKPVFRLQRKMKDFESKSQSDGAINEKGNIWGTYIHDIFKNDEFRKALIIYLFKKKGLSRPEGDNKSALEIREENYNYLADMFRKYIDMESFYKIIFEN